jgi:hypothetical protein
MATTKSRVKTRVKTEREERLIISKIELLKDLLTVEALEKPVFHSLEQAYIKNKLFNLIDEL